MPYIREPILTPVSIEELHPTQITVGMREVEDKRKRLQARPSEKMGKFLGDHMIPVVMGPKKRQYIKIIPVMAPRRKKISDPLSPLLSCSRLLLPIGGLEGVRFWCERQAG